MVAQNILVWGMEWKVWGIKLQSCIKLGQYQETAIVALAELEEQTSCTQHKIWISTPHSTLLFYWFYWSPQLLLKLMVSACHSLRVYPFCTCTYATVAIGILVFIVASLRNLSKYNSFTLNSHARSGICLLFLCFSVLFICLWFEEFFAFSKKHLKHLHYIKLRLERLS